MQMSRGVFLTANLVLALCLTGVAQEQEGDCSAAPH